MAYYPRRQDGGATDDIGDLLRGTQSDIPPQKSFPDESDVALSRKYDTTYAQPIAGYAQGDASVGIVPKDLANFWLNNNMRIGWQQKITPEQSDEYTKAWIAAQRSPVAALGFDPHHLATSPPMQENLGYAGFFKPNHDSMWFDPDYQSTPVHESIHRGLKMLRDEDMLPEHLGLKLEPEREELIVRRMMHNLFGPVEMGRGDLGDEQVRRALETIPNSDIDTIEQAAAQLYAKKHPRGPRKFGGRTGYQSGGGVDGGDEVLTALRQAKSEAGDDVQKAGGVLPDASQGDEVLRALQQAKQQAPQGTAFDQVASAAPAQTQAAPAWSDVPGQALMNLPHSAMEFGKNVVTPFVHPVETYENLRDLGHGVLQKLGVMGGEEDVAKADAVGKFLVDRYGSIDAVRNTMATDPVGFLADASTVLSGGGAGLRAAGIAGKAADIASAAGRYTDPLRAAVAPVGMAGNAVAQGLGFTTGAGAKAIKEAAYAGYVNGEKAKAFRENLRGTENMEDTVNEAREAMNMIRAARTAEYWKGLKAMGQQYTAGVVPFDKIDDALAESTKVKTYGGIPLDESTQEVRQAIGQKVALWKSLPPAQFHTPEGLDALKMAIGDIRSTTRPGSPASVVASKAYGAVRDTIIDAVPEYRGVMQGYEEASDTLHELEKTLTLPLDQRKTTIDATLRKLQSVLRNNVNTSYGRRIELANYLIDNGAPNLMARLAGQALSAPWSRGIGRLGMETAMGLAGLAGFHTGGLGMGALAAGLTVPLYSPRFIGEVAHMAGRVAGMGGITKYPIRAVGAATEPTFGYPALQLGRISGAEAGTQ